jgi:prophage tail gpP-like protein
MAMPEQEEYAELTIGGRRYRDWKSMSVTRAVQSDRTFFVFEAASAGESGKGGDRIRLGDPCEISLSGLKVVAGRVMHRQPAFTDTQHGLQILGASLHAALSDYTVDHKPGEFKGYNITQIANALAKPAGVEVVLEGKPEGADKVFPIFRVQMGETVFSALSRMARMRNLFITDDERGRLVLFRNDGKAQPRAELAEGRNIKAASGIFQDEIPFTKVEVHGSMPSSDRTWGPQASSVMGKVDNPSGRSNSTLVVAAEMPGDAQDMAMRAAHELAEMRGTQASVQIVTQGWHMDPSTLWIQLIGKTVNVYSPRLFTSESMLMAIATVSHRQDARAGSETVIDLCLPGRLGGSGRIDVGGSDA